MGCPMCMKVVAFSPIRFGNVTARNVTTLTAVTYMNLITLNADGEIIHKSLYL